MNINRKRALVGLAGVAFFGSVVASAATLGGLTSTSLGANDTVVASCDTDGIGINYTTAYAPAGGEYNVTAVNLTGVAAACSGKNISVTLNGTAGASVGSGTAVATAAATQTVTLTAPADSVLGAAVVISG